MFSLSFLTFLLYFGIILRAEREIVKAVVKLTVPFPIRVKTFRCFLKY